MSYTTTTRRGVNEKVKNLVIAGLLIALSIVIPMFMPKYQLPPFSFTLASHMPIYLAAFISPVTAVIVALGSALGFLLSGLPAYVAARAATHVVFALIASYMLRNGWALKNPLNLIIMLLTTGVVHGGLEVLVVIPFGYGGDTLPFTTAVLGGGSIIHNAIDFFIAFFIYKALSAAKLIRKVEAPSAKKAEVAAAAGGTLPEAANQPPTSEDAMSGAANAAEDAAESVENAVDNAAETVTDAAEKVTDGE
ncbi:MAG: ECF transporter S component [Clostridia bacterium]|nr:ECF transporter S component [Clostridia bacterium]